MTLDAVRNEATRLEKGYMITALRYNFPVSGRLVEDLRDVGGQEEAAGRQRWRTRTASSAKAGGPCQDPVSHARALRREGVPGGRSDGVAHGE